MGNNKSCLTLHSLHLLMCHSLYLCFSCASVFKLLVRQSRDVCVNRAPIHTGGFGHHVLIQFSQVLMGFGRGLYPNQTSWVFKGRVQWL